jgi:AcrR family transcriptional regulator
MQLIARRGIDGLTLQAIADSLDYSVGALYRYFPSKGVLVAELQRGVVRVLDAKVRLLWERCDEWLARGAVEEPETVRVLLPVVVLPSFYGRVASVVPEQFGLLADSLGDPRQLTEDADARRVLADARPIFGRMATRFGEAARVGALDPGDPLRRSLVLWASMHGVVQLRKMSRVDPVLIDTGAMLSALVEALFLGWGADRTALQRARQIAAAADLVAVPMDSADFAASPAAPGEPQANTSNRNAEEVV